MKTIRGLQYVRITPRISCERPVPAEGRARGVPLLRVPWAGARAIDSFIRLFGSIAAAGSAKKREIPDERHTESELRASLPRA
jgi:hypothetical protein